MKKKCRLLLLVFFFMCNASLPTFLHIIHAQQSPTNLGDDFISFSIQDRSIAEILLVFSDLYKKSILYDSSVTGNSSYYFTNMDFNTAFNTFLSENDLFLKIKDDIYFVSRISITEEPPNAYTVEAKQSDLSFFLDTLASDTKTTILYDSLPLTNINLYLETVSVKDIMTVVMARLENGYALDEQENYFYIKRVTEDSANKGGVLSIAYEEGDTYSIEIDEAQLDVVIQQLFRQAEREYLSYIDMRNVFVKDFFFKSKSFDDILEFLLSYADATFQIKDNIYHFFEVKNDEFVKSLKVVKSIQLSHISTDQFLAALPQNFISSNVYRADIGKNSILVTGSEQEIENFERVKEALDRPSGFEKKRFNLRQLKPIELISMLEDKFDGIIVQEIPRSESIIVYAYPETFVDIEQYIELVDSGRSVHPIYLKYIKAEYVLNNLPSSVNASEFLIGEEPSVLVFVGNTRKFASVKEEIQHIDRPTQQIRYQILVLQHNKNFDFSLGVSAQSNLTSPSDQTGVIGGITNALSVSFDLISTFGYTFTTKLDSSLSAGNSKVFIDTVLRGLSGEKVSFASDDVFRYQEAEVTGSNSLTTNRGVTREITSGFEIDIAGWISGDNTVTMDIITSLSKIGVAATTTNNPPPSSERRLETSVKTKVGEPVVIGGLYQTEDSTSNGKFFIGIADSKRRIEYVVYVIPMIEYNLLPRDEYSLQRLYSKFVE